MTYKVITDLNHEYVNEQLTISDALNSLGYNYEIITVKINNFSKSKQQILASCDKNDDILIIMITTTMFVHVDKFLNFLYQNGFTYTGVSPDYYDHSRQAMIQNAIFANIKTPKSCFIYSLDTLTKKIEEKQLSYPMFVKSELSHDSIGINEHSKVNTPEELYKQVAFILDNYGGVLVEEFIDGIELSCLVYGDIHYCNALNPVQYNFSTKTNYLTEQSKTVSILENPYWYEEVLDKEIMNKCQQTSIQLFKCLNTTGYFRIDYRVSSDGTLYMLEYNDYPSMFYKEGSTLQTILNCNKITEYEFLRDILLNYTIKIGDTTEQRYIEETGYGTYSTCDYKIGDVISDNNLSNDIQLLNIYSEKYKANSDIYNQYAYNISADTLAIWSSNPEKWKAINHSCNPNALYSNLKTVAIKPIRKNEEIRIDYNTFYTDFCFDCNCKDACCKKTLTCNDYNSFSFKNQYSDQEVSSYILMLQHYNQLIKILNNDCKINIKYDTTSNSFYIVAGQNISKDDFITNLDKLPIIPTNNKYAITKNLHEYYDTETSALQYTNHSCDPNIVITRDGSNFIAKRDICQGEMITFNYNTTEYDIIRPFDCLCGCEGCLKQIKGFKYLTFEQQQDLITSCSPLIKNYSKKINLQKKIENNYKLNLLVISPRYITYECNPILDLHCDPQKYKYDQQLITNNDIDDVIMNFTESNYDCIINLCDGYVEDQIDPGLNILKKLEDNLIPFTGSSSKIYTISKSDIQKSGYSPKFITYDDYKTMMVHKLSYPLIIKPNNLGGSELIDDKSVVYDKNELDIKLLDVVQHTSDVLIQEYIEGDEYTCLIFKNRFKQIICLPIHIKFNGESKYKTKVVKMDEYETAYNNSIITDNLLVEQIKQVMVNTYEILELDSYIRCDIRIDNKTKQIYVIDVNPYPGVFSPYEEKNTCDHIILMLYNNDDFLKDIITMIFNI